jgi:hypothetical protein
VPTRRQFLGLTAAFGLTACAGPPAPAPAAAAAPPVLDGPDALLDWIAAHPERASVLVDDGRGPVISHLADRPRPIASAVKAVHLVAYAQAVADGRLDPAAPVAVREWERWYVPGADGGAHPAALEALGVGSGGSTTWDGIVAAMIDLSDNAAADLVLATLGADALTAAAAAVGWTPFDVPHIAGETLLFLSPDAGADRRAAAAELGAAYAAGDPAARALGGRYTGGTAAGGPIPDWTAGLDFWGGSWAATAEQLVALHRAAATGALGEAVSGTVQRHLERGLTGRLPAGVLGFGQKAGNLPGTVSWAGAVRRDDGSTGAAAVLLSGLPQDVYAQVPEAVLRLGQQALIDPAVAERMRQVL